MKKLDRALTLRTEEPVSCIRKMTSFSWEVGALESDLGEFISSLLAISWLLFVCVCLFFGLLFWLAMKWISHLAAEVDPGWLKPIYSLFPRWACGLIQATERGRDSFAAWRMKKGVRLRTSVAPRKPENFTDRSENWRGFPSAAFGRRTPWQILWIWPLKKSCIRPSDTIMGSWLTVLFGAVIWSHCIYDNFLFRKRKCLWAPALHRFLESNPTKPVVHCRNFLWWLYYTWVVGKICCLKLQILWMFS